MRTTSKNDKANPPPTLQGEEWRCIEGWPSYEVSNFGRVFSTRGKSIILKAYLERDGYLSVRLLNDICQRTKRVHTLVAAAFLGPRPDGMDIRHLNGIRNDNHIGNLKYGTAKENADDRSLHGRTMFGTVNHAAKITENEVKEIRLLYVPNSKSNGGMALSRKYSLCHKTIREIVRGEIWKQVIPERAVYYDHEPIAYRAKKQPPAIDQFRHGMHDRINQAVPYSERGR